MKKSVILKIIAVFFSSLFLFSFAISGALTLFLANNGFYTMEYDDILKEQLIEKATAFAERIANFTQICEMNKEEIGEVWGNYNFTFRVFYKENAKTVTVFDNTNTDKSEDVTAEPDASYTYTFYKQNEKTYYNDNDDNFEYNFYPYDPAFYDKLIAGEEFSGNIAAFCTVEIFINDISAFTYNDVFRQTAEIVSVLSKAKNIIPIVCAVSFVLLLLTDLFIVCAAGHRKDCSHVRENFLDKLPFDILVAIYISIAAIEFWTIDLIDSFKLATILLFTAVDSLLISYLILTVSTRCKVGKIIRNTVIFKVLSLVTSLVKHTAKAFAKLIKNIPLVWRTVLICIVISFTELIFISALSYETDILILLWFLEKTLVVPFIIYIAIMLRKLQKGADELSKGNLSYKINTSAMIGDIRRHGEILNNLNNGLSVALESKIKSERLKTELITNVSHDIKTPLTSIVNYVDLLKKENLDNEKANEYIDVLDRQSARLKKLTDDLVEASKASTGNIPVSKSPVDLSVLLVQLSAEYEEKAKEKGLEIIIKDTEIPSVIMADGRLLQRVIDNLMTNICKYSLENTRVYIDFMSFNGKSSLVFKNISKYPLNISSDELTERFVRGDSSRNTEGSGLGLSIAKSLTELQGGSLFISTDGDLFKVVLTFDEV